MATSRRRASGRKQARRYHAARPHRLVPKGHELLPTTVLKQLSESGLPADKRVYNARLRELLEAR